MKRVLLVVAVVVIAIAAHAGAQLAVFALVGVELYLAFRFGRWLFRKLVEL